MESILLDLLDLDDPADLELFNLAKKAGVCKSDLRFPLNRKKLGEIARGKLARLARDKVHNQHISGKTLPHVEMYPSQHGAYTLRVLKEWADLAHREEPLPHAHQSLGLQSGNTLKEAIVQASMVKKGV